MITKHRIEEFIRGWIVGNFKPTLIKTNAVEVAYQIHTNGDKEKRHYHKIATEITVVVEGTVKMNDKIYSIGDIIKIEPNDSTDFESLSNSACLVIKYPGANNDKYIIE